MSEQPKHYAHPFSLHGTPDEQDAYRARVSRLNRHRGQTCPNCDATDSHFVRSFHGALYYHCDSCHKEFGG